jgi:hypothetical protein
VTINNSSEKVSKNPAATTDLFNQRREAIYV